MPFDAAGFVIPAPVVETETQRVISEAANILRRVGRCRAHMREANGSVCLLSALGYRDGFNYSACEASQRTLPFVVAAIIERDGEPKYGNAETEEGRQIVTFYFNDQQQHTDEDVLAVLYRAYELAAS